MFVCMHDKMRSEQFINIRIGRLNTSSNISLDVAHEGEERQRNTRGQSIFKSALRVVLENFPKFSDEKSVSFSSCR